MTDYIKTPKSISVNDIEEKGYTLSSSQYRNLYIANKNLKTVRQFLSRTLRRTDLGIEVGSQSYIDKSPCRFIKPKAFQSYSFLPEITSESALHILPQAFINHNLKEGDILISKDSNIGETVILDKDYPDCMLSGAIYKLPLDELKYYLLAFIKHPIFREQLDFMVPKGATIRHAGTRFLDCKIPIPNHNTSETITYVEALTKAIINKEKQIRQRHCDLMTLIDIELSHNQKNTPFKFEYPKYSNLSSGIRLDATYHSETYHKLMFPVINYRHGYCPLTEQGLELKPGPSLELKLLGTRIDSDKPIKGFYRLITPKQIHNYGTIKYYEYIGTPKRIQTIRYGDILFGESGTGRSMVYLDHDKNTINNAHAHILRPIEGRCSLNKAITIRCILQYYKEKGIIDCLTVGGAGGHLSPSYFDRVYIPTFDTDTQNQIARFYHTPDIKYDSSKCTLYDFEEYDNRFNMTAGIHELSQSQDRLQKLLTRAIDHIAEDSEVPFVF